MHEIQPDGEQQDSNNNNESVPMPDEIQTQLESDSTDQDLLDVGKGIPSVNLNQD